jgi:heme-degrading monooxygenase HmoA
MTITHVVIFGWTEDTSSEAVEEIATTLRGFIADAELPGLQSWTCGRDAGFAENNADFAVVAVFDDADAYTTYRDHPEHRRIITEQIAPRLASRSVVQFAG